MNTHYRNNPSMLKRVRGFKNELVTLRSLTPFAAFKFIRKAIGYDAFIRQYAGDHSSDPEKLFEILDNLEAEAADFTDLTAWAEHAKSAELTSSVPEENTEDGIKLMTIHASKGLEFTAVFIPSLADGILPGKNTDAISDLEEERRILYVAMTRAKEYLCLSWPQKLHNKKAAPCRFLKELPCD